MEKTYAVYLEICDIETKKEADELAKIVENRFDDLGLRVNVCISEYYTRENK